MLLLIMTSATTLSSRTRHAPAVDEGQPALTACTDWKRIRCIAYSDREIAAGASFIWANVTIVAPSQYLGDAYAHPTDCCRFSDRARTLRNQQPLLALRTEGTTFFCESHRNRTLAAQYRFLPALVHARRELLNRGGSSFLPGLGIKHFHWVVLVDDDSVLRVEHLLRTLDSLDHTKRLLAGDLVPWEKKPPWDILGQFSSNGVFACGGSGAAMSQRAVIDTNFDACARRLHQGCYQSDWMLGQCVSEYGVAPVHHLSCDLCRNYCGLHMKGCE